MSLSINRTHKPDGNNTPPDTFYMYRSEVVSKDDLIASTHWRIKLPGGAENRGLSAISADVPLTGMSVTGLGTTPENLADGSPATHWIASGDQPTPYVELSFTQAISPVKFMVYGGTIDTSPSEIRVEVATEFDNTGLPIGWNQVYSGSDITWDSTGEWKTLLLYDTGYLDMEISTSSGDALVACMNTSDIEQRVRMHLATGASFLEVNTIDERDQLDLKAPALVRVYDASGDSQLETGKAIYVYDPVKQRFVLIHADENGLALSEIQW
jgi:hypothetical protein